MKPATDSNAVDRWPRWWRLAMVALGVLILSSCRGASSPTGADVGQVANLPGTRQIGNLPHTGLPPEAYSGAPMAVPPPAGPPCMEMGPPLPYAAMAPWRPPGIAGPWPPDEYVCDGGDAGLPTEVSLHGAVRGLEMEDAVAHFETLDGRVGVQPSNRVCLYAPRFGAVRQVVNLEESKQRDRAAGVYVPTHLQAPRLSQPVGNNKQNLQAVGQVGARPAEILRRRQQEGVVSSRLGPREFENHFRAFENVTAIRMGVMTESETAFLAQGVTSARAWTTTQAVQVVIDRRAANAEVGIEKLDTFYTIGSPPGNPRLRLIKVASTPMAEPGDEVDFTLRFDNLGNQTLGNVVILDSLNTRLEYIPDSAQCSREAQFSTRANEGDSVVLRCEVTDPIPPGKGGILRFRCRVR